MDLFDNKPVLNQKMAKRWQAIIWTSDVPVYFKIYESLGLDELNSG